MNKYLFLFITLLISTLLFSQQKQYAPSQIILELNSSQKITSKTVKNSLSKIKAVEIRYLGFSNYYLLKVENNSNLDSLIKVLNKMGLKANKDELIPFAEQATIQVNDSWNDMGYWNSLNQNILPAKNNMDNVLAYLPPIYKNNADDAIEKVTFIHTEIPRLTHYDMPFIDSLRSVDFYRGGIPINGVNATTHGSETGGCGYAKWDNANTPIGFNGGMVGMTNNKKPIILNTADANNGYVSADISMLFWCYNYCQTYPDRRLVISYSFAGSSMPQPIATQITAQNKILLMHSAGNSNVAAFNYVDAFQLNIMASTASGQKASFSNFGQYVDIAFQGAGMRGLSSTDDVTTVGWQGTSASAPCVTGLLVTLWNLMPTKTASEMKAMLKNRLNTTCFIPQPDGSLSVPNLRFWYLLSNQIFPIVHTYQTPIRASLNPTINFGTIVNDLINTQINRHFFWQNGSNWTELTNGIATLNELGSGKRNIKYRWINSQTIGQDGQNTFSEIVRQIEIYNTKPLFNSSINYCTSQSSFRVKLKNCPDVNSLDTFQIFQGSSNISNTYNFTDSTFTVTPSGATSVNIKVKYYKKNDPTIADSTEAIIIGTNTIQTLTNTISNTAFTPCAGPYSTFTAVSNSTTNNFQWKKNGVNVGNSSSTYNDSSLVNGNQISCVVSPLNGCWNTTSLTSNTVTITIPSCTDNLNNVTVGDANLITYQNTYCDGEAYFNGVAPTFNNYPVIRYDNQSWLPKQGTIEMLVKVQNGYTWFNGNSATSATIFAIDSNGLTKSSFIIGYANGNVTFRRFNSATQTFIDITATATPFRFNEWHVISVSYGSIGTIIRVDGTTYATNTTANFQLNDGHGFLGGANFQDASNWWGIYGFKGWVDKFRLSYTQSDWQLALANQPPTANILASTNNICFGTSVTFTATTNAPTASYQWKKNGMNVGGNSPTYVDNGLLNSNSVNCVVTATSGCFGTPINTSNTITMVVNTPLVPLTIITASANNICPGTSIMFTAATNAPTANYQWKKNGVNVGANATTFTDNTLLNNDQITCLVSATSGCYIATATSANTITVNVVVPLTPSVSISVSRTNPCVGENVSFTATPTNGGTTPTFQWKRNGINVSNGITYSTTTLANADIITCVLTTSLSCVTSTTANSNSINITVRPIITPTASITSTATTICQNLSITFTASTNIVNPVYQWKINNINTAANNNTFTSSSLNNNDVVSCTITAPAVDCYSSYTINSNNISISVRPLLTPTITIMSNDADNILCEGQLITYTATSINGGSAPIYQWKKNGLNVGSNFATFNLTTPSNNDEVSCIVTSNENCLATNNIESNKIKIEVVQVNPTITKNGFTLTVTPQRIGAAWQWYKDGQIIAGATNRTFNVSIFGNYSVKETFKTCNKFSNTLAIIPFANNNGDDIKVYPNPANELLFAQSRTNDIKIKSVTIFDETGKRILSQSFPNTNLVQINLSALSNSIYIAFFKTNGKTVRTKFIKQ